MSNGSVENEGHGNKGFFADESNSVIEIKSAHLTLELPDKYKNQSSPQDDNYDPYQHRNVNHPTTNTETFIHLLKSSLGTGILAIPNAFRRSGFVVGVIATIIIGTIAVYGVHILLKCNYELCKRKKVPSMKYPDIAKTAILEGPPSLHKFAPYIAHVSNVFILTYQIGICCVYVIFVSTNLKALVDHYNGIETDVRIYMLIILLPLILINWVPNLKYLAPFSTIANFMTIISFAIIAYYVFREPISLDGKIAAGTLSDFPFFFGTILFALEAIGVIMPLENEMRTPKHFVGITGVLNRAMVLIVLLYICTGLFGYLKYGQGIQASITLNLPEDEILASSAKIMLTFGIFITHALACYVAIDIVLNDYVGKRMAPAKPNFLMEYFIRTVVVLITFILAIAVPNLELFISLFGALCLSSLGLAFPAIIEYCTFYQRSGSEKTILVIRDLCLGIFGAFGFFIGTGTSLIEIVKTLF